MIKTVWRVFFRLFFIKISILLSDFERHIKILKKYRIVLFERICYIIYRELILYSHDEMSDGSDSSVK